jgi:hypothetical protein
VTLHHKTMTRRFAFIVACSELGAGVTGVALSYRFSGPSYKPARELLSGLPGNAGLYWSGLLVVLSLWALWALLRKSASARTPFAFLMGYWSFWLVLWSVAMATPGSGPWAPFTALIWMVGNARPVVAPTLRD